MTVAWYGHLKEKSTSLWLMVLVSWRIAFFEYCFQVPANRVGHGHFSPAQLKTIQEVIRLLKRVHSIVRMLSATSENRQEIIRNSLFACRITTVEPRGRRDHGAKT